MAQSYIDANALAEGLKALVGADKDPIDQELKLQRVAALMQQQKVAEQQLESTKRALEKDRANRIQQQQLALLGEYATRNGMTVQDALVKYGQDPNVAVANIIREQKGLGLLPEDQAQQIRMTNTQYFEGRGVPALATQYNEAKSLASAFMPPPSAKNGAYDRGSVITPTMEENWDRAYGTPTVPQGVQQPALKNTPSPLAALQQYDQELQQQQAKRAKGQNPAALGQTLQIAAPIPDATDPIQVAKDVEQATLNSEVDPIQVAKDAEQATLNPEQALQAPKKAVQRITGEIAKDPQKAVEVVQHFPPQAQQQAVLNHAQATFKAVQQDPARYDPKRFITLPKGVPLRVDKETTYEQRLATYAATTAYLTARYGREGARRIMKEEFGLTPQAAHAYVTGGVLPGALANIMTATANAVEAAQRDYDPATLARVQQGALNVRAQFYKVLAERATQAQKQKTEALKQKKLQLGIKKTTVGIATDIEKLKQARNETQQIPIKNAQRREDLLNKRLDRANKTQTVVDAYYDDKATTDRMWSGFAQYFKNQQVANDSIVAFGGGPGVAWSLDDTGIAPDGGGAEIDRFGPNSNIVIRKDELQQAVHEAKATVEHLYRVQHGGKLTPNAVANLAANKSLIEDRLVSATPWLKVALASGASKPEAFNFVAKIAALPINPNEDLLIGDDISEDELPAAKKRFQLMSTLLKRANLKDPYEYAKTAVAANLALKLSADGDSAITPISPDMITKLADKLTQKLTQVGLDPLSLSSPAMAQVLPGTVRKYGNLYKVLSMANTPEGRDMLRESGVPAEAVQNLEVLADYLITGLASGYTKELEQKADE